jgi:hypothetical protein
MKEKAEANKQETKAKQVKKEIDDYSGEFIPDLQFENFSKEGLIKLAKSWSLYLLILHWGWREVVNERHGFEEEFQCWLQAWLKAGPRAAERMAKMMNIPERNVIGYFKELQLDPTFPMYRFKHTFEIINPNLGYITVDRCPALDVWEKEGNTELIQRCCHDLEPPTFTQTGRYFHPNLKCIPLKLPPRKSPDEVACQWEVRID